MSRRVRIVIVAFVLGAMLFVAAGAAAFFGVREYRRAAWREAGIAQFEQGNWQAASENLSRYLPHDPSNIELLSMYADANAHILEDRPAALRNVAHAYQQILRYAPGNEDAQAKLLQLYERQGAWDVLEYYAAEWLKNSPDRVDLLQARAMALDRSGSRDDAIAAYEALFDQGAGQSAEWARYAALLKERYGEKRASELLGELIESQPDGADALTAAAQYWLGSGDVESAKHYLALTAEAAPQSNGHLLLRARIAGSEQRWDDALELLDQLPTDAETLGLRANVLLARGNPDEAADVLAESAPEMRIDHPRLQIVLIDSLYGLGRTQEARTEADSYLRAYPLDTATRNYVDGRDAMSEDRFSDAAEALAVAVELRPDFRAARLALATAELAAGDSAAGRSVLESYLREFPSDDNARALWSRYFGMGEREASRIAAGADSDSADPDALMAAASAMAEAAMRESVLPERAASIANLSQQASQVDPKNAASYQFEVGMWLRVGDVDRARTVVAAAESNVELAVFEELNGTVALAENRIDDAWAAFQRSLESLDIQEYAAWARKFARSGAYEKALQALDVGEERLDETDFAIERIELAAEFGPLESAWELIAGNASAEPRHRRASLVFASRLLDSPSPENAPRLDQLASSLDNADDAYTLVLRALAGSDEESDALLEEAERLAPGDALVLDRLRAVRESDAQYDAALSYAERAAAADPANDRLRFALGRLQAMNGLTVQAERNLRDVLARTPSNIAARKLLVQTLLDAGHVDAAEAALAELPDGDRPDRLRSSVLMARNAHAEAETVLRARLEKSPGDPSARWDLAVCLRQLGRGNEGEQILTDAAQRESASVEDWAALARFFANDDSDVALEQASRAALRALLLEPTHAESLRTLAGIRERQGDPAAALAVLRRYTQTREDDAAAWHRRAQLELASGGRWEDALASIENAYSIAPNPEYRALRGYVHAGMQNYAEAIVDLEEAAADLPATSADLDLTLAECFVRTNRLDEADHRLAAAERKLARRESPSLSRLEAIKGEIAARRRAE